ncbi:hypothetical protein RRG08_014213 [Elysia crispata]|uniref:Uncharacterized protein n=1 Tax=Elysia crispata TaxID=231223 RepID=A0AAE1CES6_9GAST|nr:hypothetical protein RRG08_014213 [Elysia crispata]
MGPKKAEGKQSIKSQYALGLGRAQHLPDQVVYNSRLPTFSFLEEASNAPGVSVSLFLFRIDPKGGPSAIIAT